MKAAELDALLAAIGTDLRTEADRNLATLPAFVRQRVSPLVDKLLRALDAHRAAMTDMRATMDRVITELERHED